MKGTDISKYSHSPVHYAIASRNYTDLGKILDNLPRLRNPAEIHNEAISIEEEAKAETISSFIDRRDVPYRETPLHLAVKLGDMTATEMLMAAGADWSLQNEQGWNALQEAISNGEKEIATIIVRHYQPLAWAKWCRRLPRLKGAMRRMKDFYMEITFHFESSVIPFISKIAPSDTYKIWKRGSNLRADMTLTGFDGFKIQRSDQSIVFLGDGGSDNGKNIVPGSLYIISHKDKEVTNALDGKTGQATESEIQQEVDAMSRTSIFRPGVDVTQAILSPQLTWTRQEKIEMVGPWKAKVYDMLNVLVSIKSRRISGAMVSETGTRTESETESGTETEVCNDTLTEDGQRQSDGNLKGDSSILRDILIEEPTTPFITSFCAEKRVCSEESSSSYQRKQTMHSLEVTTRPEQLRKAKDKKKSCVVNSKIVDKEKEPHRENEYKKGLRPIIWLSPNFPLKTEELLPLLDILSSKVKAIRRLKELLTTKLPPGTFPVKVAIPIVPTIRVLVTFTKFEELQPFEEFYTHSSSSFGVHNRSATTNFSSGSSWLQWIKAPNTNRIRDTQDPFAIPSNYTWKTTQEKK